MPGYDDFRAEFLDTTTGTKNKFYVVTASNGFENSWGDPSGSCLMERLDRALSRGDYNNDGTIDLRELDSFLQTTYSEVINTIEGPAWMHPQVYPKNSSFPIFVKH